MAAPAPLPAAPATVTQPGDVVAGATVMARFRDSEPVADATPAGAATTLVAAVAK